MSSTKTIARMHSRVTELSATFDQFVTAFASRELFTGPSLYFHKKTLAIRASHCSAVEAIQDERFFEYLYATLTAWGMHRMGQSHAKLADLDQIRDSFVDRAAAIGEIESLRLRDLSTNDAKDVGAKLWAIIEGLRVSTSETRIVACSKAVHHLLPLLLPPIDREYTLRFFYNHKTISRGDRATFLEIFPCFQEIAATQGDHLAELVGQGMNTSETKVIDNAIVGYVLNRLK
jgi:hypothetical protein